jgi:hypothetical protein
VRLIAIIIALFFAGSTVADDWKEYDNAEYSFAIHFPVDPTIGATTYRTADGRSFAAHEVPPSLSRMFGYRGCALRRPQGVKRTRHHSPLEDGSRGRGHGGRSTMLTNPVVAGRIPAG